MSCSQNNVPNTFFISPLWDEAWREELFLQLKVCCALYHNPCTFWRGVSTKHSFCFFIDKCIFYSREYNRSCTKVYAQTTATHLYTVCGQFFYLQKTLNILILPLHLPSISILKWHESRAWTWCIWITIERRVCSVKCSANLN